MYTSIDLFAGIGGIRLGFDNAFGDTITTTFVSEWDAKAQQTYRANFAEPSVIHGDITKVDEADVPAHDILLAGFPCQAFSLAGHKRGFEDTRGTLFFDVARIVRRHQPKVVFCENVKNLVTHDKRRTFAKIVQTFEELGYTVFSQILNSRDYGVPQNRERIYMVAFRADLGVGDFEFPAATDTSATIADIIEEDEVAPRYYLSDVYLKCLRDHRARHESKGNGFGYQVRGYHEVAAAVVCGGMGRERNLVVDDRLTNWVPETHIKGRINREFVRKMTPREWARLQGFPDSFRLTVANTHLYKQLGNSVTVTVIEAIAREIRRTLASHDVAPVVTIRGVDETLASRGRARNACVVPAASERYAAV